ncbi:gp23 [Burkholderia sp. YI23]|nr:gp23 [Burkholderia sp. YI23]
MPAGFQAFSADGTNTIQIDSDTGLPNFQLRQKITQTMASGPIPVYTVATGAQYTSSGPQATFSFYAISPLIVFECSGAHVCPHAWTKSGNNYTVTVVGDAAVPVTIYVFDQNDFSVGANRYGLQVFNASGVLVADAVAAFAKPVGFSQGNPKYAYGSTGYTTDSGTWGTDQGTSSFSVVERVGIACVQPAFAIGGTAGGATNAGINLSTFLTSGNSVNVNMTGFGDNRNNNNYVGFREALSWSYMAVDISYL